VLGFRFWRPLSPTPAGGDRFRRPPAHHADAVAPRSPFEPVTPEGEVDPPACLPGA